MRRGVSTVVVLCFVCLLGGAGAASGDGGPGPGVVFAWTGITHGNMRDVTVPSPSSWTTVEAVQRDGGKVIEMMNLNGAWGIPLVASAVTTGGWLPAGRQPPLA